MIKKILSITSVAALIAILSGCGRINIIGPGMSTNIYDNADKYIAGGAELSGPVDSLDINWVSGQVNIISYSGSTVKFSETANRELNADSAMHYWLENGTLHIQFSKSGKWDFSKLNKTLELWLPEGMEIYSFETDNISADLTAEGISAQRIDLDTVSGKIKLTDCAAAHTFEADSTSGKIELSLCKAGEGLNIDSTSGDISFTDCQVQGEVSLESTSGKISGVLNGSMADLDVSTVSGAIELELENVDSIEAESTSGSVSLRLPGMPQDCQVQTVSGRVSLYLPREASFELVADSTSGRFDSKIPTSTQGDRHIAGNGDSYFYVETTSGSIFVEAIN